MIEGMPWCQMVDRPLSSLLLHWLSMSQRTSLMVHYVLGVVPYHMLLSPKPYISLANPYLCMLNHFVSDTLPYWGQFCIISHSYVVICMFRHQPMMNPFKAIHSLPNYFQTQCCQQCFPKWINLMTIVSISSWCCIPELTLVSLSSIWYSSPQYGII